MTTYERDISNSDGFLALMYQLLETELTGVKVYETALTCVVDEDLKREWQKYLGETKRHVEIAQSLLEDLGLDPSADIPARVPVRTIGCALIEAMREAKEKGTADEAQLTAAECVVDAETKDHMNWELIGQLAESAAPEFKRLLRRAHEQVETQEDHHLYHTSGWARELWIQALGLPAALPPPEELKNVESAVAAARAKSVRKEMIE